MKKGIRKIYIIEIIILIITVLLFFIKSVNNKNLLSIISLGIILFVLSIIYKKKKDTNLFRKQAFTMVCSIVLFYFIIIFLLGLILGYNKTLFSLNINTIIHGLLPAFLITVIIERIRFIIIKNNADNKISIYILTLLLIVLSIVISTNNITLNNWYLVFLFICVTLLPTIAKELLSTYMTFNYGFLPTIAYKLIMNLYIYIIPIFTNLGNYLISAIGIIIPFTIYVFLSKYIQSDEEIRRKKKKIKGINLNFITIPTLILLVVIISLVSGIFKYKMIAIASNSMIPTYYRGDALIIENYDNRYLQEGEIIVFKKGNVLIAHRIVKTKESSDKLYFYTKGDANKSVDDQIVSQDEVEGVVKRVVKYIGYPTVWINELFRR